jgi:hypothetical protein
MATLAVSTLAYQRGDLDPPLVVPSTGAFFPVDASSTLDGDTATGWTVARNAYTQNQDWFLR